MFDKYYKPSKKISWGGLAVLALVMLVVGSAVSWVYLWINRNCTIVYLDILVAVALGFITGGVGRVVVKKLKLRNPTAVLVAAVVGVLGMNYVKWATYDYYDYKQIEDAASEYVNKDLKAAMMSEKAYTYFEFDYDFDDEYYTFDENYEYLQDNAYDAVYAYYLYYNADINEDYTKAEQEEMKNKTLYEWYDYTTLLGKTKEQCEANLAKSKELSAYEYLKEIDEEDYIAGVFSDAYSAPSFIKVLTHPGDLWADIKSINEVGRWSYTSSSSSYSSSTTSSSTNDDTVKGGMLWVVWICEFLTISLIAVIFAYKPSKNIFIEYENEWAEEYDNNKFTFNAMNASQLKATLEQTPDNILNLAPVEMVALGNRPYIKLTVSHSRDYSENYLNAYNMSYNYKSKNYVPSNIFKGLKMTPMQTGVLFDLFGLQAPGKTATDAGYQSYKNYQIEKSLETSDIAQMMEQAINPNAAASGFNTCGSCGGQVPVGKKFCPHCGAPYEEVNSTAGRMDSIDTTNL